MTTVNRASLFVCLLAVSATAQTGVSGVLTTEDGKPVDAVIRALRMNAAPFGSGKPQTGPSQPIFAYVTANKSAAFSFSSLPAGVYELCATVPAGGYVDPCLWETHGVMVSVPPNQRVTGVSVSIKKSSTLKVRIEDPSRYIRNSAQGAMAMGVFGPGGRWIPAIVKGEDNTGKNYELAVPFDRALKFFVRPVGLTAVDSGNAPIDGGSSLTVRHPSSGPPPPVLSYRVTGRK